MKATDFTGLNDQTLTDTIASTHRSLTIHKARFILMIAEFHLRNLARKRGAPSTQVWLMRAHDLSRRTAYEYLHVGEKLAEFPLVAEAFVAGDLTYSKVRLLLRYLTHDNEPELVDLALAMCLSELEQQLAGRDRPGRKKPRNSFRVVEDEDTGGIRFWGTLGPEHAAEFQAALKVAELASLRDTADLDADALAGPEGSKELDKLIEQAQKPAEDTSLTRFGSPMFGGMLSAFLGMINVVRSHPTSRLRAPGAQVNVLMTLDQRAYIPERHGGQTGDLLRSVLNGDVRYHLLDKKGLHLKLTRAARTISPSQEKALLALWSHRCATPGCPHTRFLQFHHLLEWVNGGETNLDNLLPLCSACHALVTSGDITIFIDEIDATFLRFRMPDGEAYTSHRRQLPVKNAAMGRHADAYLSGPVPRGDEDLLQVWDSPDSFTDPDDDFGTG